MIPYIFAYILCAVFFIEISFLVKNPEKKNYIFTIIGFVFVSILLCLRHPSMGTDLGYHRGFGYLASFQTIQFFSIEYIFRLSSFLNYEKGYVIFNKLISFISDKQQSLLIFCGLFSLFPIFYVFYKKSLNVCLSMVIYLGLPCFIILFSGLRQGLAIGICFFSLFFIEKKQLLYFVLTVCFAMLFHKSAVVFLIAYFIYNFQISNKIRLYVTIPVLIVIFILKSQLFIILSSLFRENVMIDNNGAINLFIVFVLIYIFCSLLYRKNRCINGYLNLFFCACVCQSFASLYSTALRIGYYFIIFLTLLLPQILSQINDKLISNIIKISIYICFILFSLYSLYRTSWAMSYPYIFFWE